MNLTDSEDLRELLSSLFLGQKLVIDGPAKASGQRVVYFSRFEEKPEEEVEDPRIAEAGTWGEVVVKVSESSDPTALAYLEKEVEILGTIQSDAFPKLLYDRIIRTDPRTNSSLPKFLFLTIEQRVAAEPLSAKREQFRTSDSICSFLLNAVSSLKIMWEHPARFVHRDLKPDNILIREDGSVVIIDLGIVREEGVTGITNSNVPYGPCSILYASPEQATNQKRLISFKSDIFSLGIVSYELATGINPFGRIGDRFSSVIENICTLQQAPLRESGHNDHFSDLVDKMLRKQPYQRHRRIDDLISDLARVKSQP